MANEPVSRVLIVGASLAGTRTAEALLAAGFAGEITIAGDESHPPYDRPPLSKGYLCGEMLDESLRLDGAFGASGPSGGPVRWRLGSAAVSLDPANRLVTFDDGGTESYDRLVIACGTTPVVPAGLDMTLDGVHLMRTLDDARQLRRRLGADPGRVAVIGAGFIGAELASTCRSQGIPATLIDIAAVPLARPLGEEVARRLMSMHEAAGTEFKLGVTAERLESRTSEGSSHVRRRVSGVVCSDGTTVDADVVVVAIGVRPAIDWLEGSGLELDNGVVCNPDLSTVSYPDVLAVGDVARWEHPMVGEVIRVEHWSNAVEGAQVVAETIMGQRPRHDSIPSFWSDQLGVKIQGIGLTSLADDVEIDDTDGALFATYRRDGRLVGAVSFGKPRRLIAVRRDLTASLRSQ